VYCIVVYVKSCAREGREGGDLVKFTIAFRLTALSLSSLSFSLITVHISFAKNTIVCVWREKTKRFSLTDFHNH